MATGQIKKLVTDRGFGFIQETGESSDIFFHRSSLGAGVYDQLSEGQTVEFEKEADSRNPRKMRAVNVRVAELQR